MLVSTGLYIFNTKVSDILYVVRNKQGIFVTLLDNNVVQVQDFKINKNIPDLEGFTSSLQNYLYKWTEDVYINWDYIKFFNLFPVIGSSPVKFKLIVYMSDGNEFIGAEFSDLSKAQDFVIRTFDKRIGK